MEVDTLNDYRESLKEIGGAVETNFHSLEKLAEDPQWQPYVAPLLEVFSTIEQK